MSAFLVVLRFDGVCIRPELYRRLAGIVAYRGPDGSGEADFPECMLLHHHMRSMRACAGEVQPLQSKDRKLAIVCDARLDQRRELIRDLRRAGREIENKAPTSELLLTAYSIWKDDLLEKVSGDFSFVIVDRGRRKLLAARDPFGLRLLYYGSFPGGLILSNDPLPIMAHPEINLSLDRLALADFLLTGRVTAIDPTLTPFQAMRQLPGGHRLLLDLDSGQSDIRRFWHFPMNSTPLYYSSLGDYGEHFRSVFKGAVRDRIDAQEVVAPMSGGMDSTTAVAIAAEVIKDGDGPERFTAVTAVRDDRDPEGLLAEEVCRGLGIAHHRIEVQPGNPLARWRPSPFPAANFHQGYEKNQRLSAKFGRVSLNGSSADYVLCPEPFTVLGQLKAAGIRDTWRALGIVRNRYGYRPRIGSGLSSRFRGSKAINPFTRPAYPYPSWIAGSFERELGLRDRWESYWTGWPSTPHPLRPTAHRMIMARDRLSMHSLGWPVDFAPPIAADPFLDARVLGFLWSLPPLPWFYNKHLTREAMRDRLPKSVLDRPKTPARSWMPSRDGHQADFSWRPGPLLGELMDLRRLPDLSSDRVSPADFHPMFLQKWLDGFGAELEERLGKSAQSIE